LYFFLQSGHALSPNGISALQNVQAAREPPAFSVSNIKIWMTMTFKSCFLYIGDIRILGRFGVL